MPRGGKKVDKDEKERRVRAVQEWILQGYATSDIIRQASISCNITDRQAYKYHKEAYGFFKAANEQSIEDLKAYHIELRKKLYRDLKRKDVPSGARTALRIIDSIARIDGVTPLMYKGNGTDYSSSSDDSDDESIPTMLLPDGREIEI